MSLPVLLAITELGGYPDFTSLYKSCGYDVIPASSMRKALSAIKKQAPDVIVTEFNFQSDFRDRTSSIETLMATLQGKGASPAMIVFYEQEYQNQFEKVTSRFEITHSFSFPVDQAALEQKLRSLVAANVNME